MTATGKLLFVHTPGAAARVHVTPETRRWRRAGILHLDPVVVAWLAERMHPGDVLYDIGAGIGAYTILAALERGGLAVAFEPGFASFSRLCENLLLNGCYRSVIPVPAALADREGLAEMVYPHTPGEDTHALTERRWRARLDRVESRYTQPVCTDRLDGLVARQRLPAPHVVRINVRKNPDRVLAGAADVLRQPQLRSVLVSIADAAQAESVLRAVDGLGFAHTLSPGQGRLRRIAVPRAEWPRAAVIRFTLSGGLLPGCGQGRDAWFAAARNAIRFEVHVRVQGLARVRRPAPGRPHVRPAGGVSQAGQRPVGGRLRARRARSRGVLGRLRRRARVVHAVDAGAGLAAAAREVVRRRHAERQRQLRGPPRARAAAEQGRAHLGRGAGRPPHADLLRSVPAGQPVRQRAQVARRDARRPRRASTCRSCPSWPSPCWPARASARCTRWCSAASAPSRCATASTTRRPRCSSPPTAAGAAGRWCR